MAVIASMRDAGKRTIRVSDHQYNPPIEKGPACRGFSLGIARDQAVPTLEIAPRKLPAEQTAVCKRFKLDLLLAFEWVDSPLGAKLRAASA